MTDWLPIESAPRDGTEVLLFIPGATRKIHKGYFIDSEDFQYGKSVRKRQCWSIGFQLSFHADPEPTLWQPLPELPENTEDDAAILDEIDRRTGFPRDNKSDEEAKTN